MIVRRAFFLERFLENLWYVDVFFFSKLIKPEGDSNAFLYRTLPFFRGYSNECDDSSGLCDDSVGRKWFWNGLSCIIFRESPQIDSFFCRISSVTMSPKSSQSFCRDSFDSAWRALRSVWNCPLNTAYKNNGSRNFGKSPQQEASLFMLRVLSPESSFTKPAPRKPTAWAVGGIGAWVFKKDKCVQSVNKKATWFLFASKNIIIPI